MTNKNDPIPEDISSFINKINRIKDHEKKLDFLRDTIKVECGINEQNWDKIRKGFTSIWTLERVKSMILEEYTDTNKAYSFTYWIENELKGLGDIHGATSIKFGIYKFANKKPKNYKGDDEYAWKGSLGDNRNSVFEKIQENILDVIKYITKGELEKIDAIWELSSMFKWKIAFLYDINEKIIPIFSIDLLRYVGKDFNLCLSPMASYTECYKNLLEIQHSNIYELHIYLLSGNGDAQEGLDKFRHGIYYGLARSSYNNFKLLYDTSNKVIYWDNKSKNKWKIGDNIFFKDDSYFYKGVIINVNDSYEKRGEKYFVGSYELSGPLDRTSYFEGENFIKVTVTEIADINTKILTYYGLENNKIVKGQAEIAYLDDAKNDNIVITLKEHFSKEMIRKEENQNITKVGYRFQELKFDVTYLKNNKTSKTKKTSSNIDYIKKAINCSKIGLIGEEIVLNHEKVINGEKVIWESKLDNNLGYDILSYDGDIKKYIEVKSTNSGDKQIFISINEILKSKELKNYWIYFVNMKTHQISTIQITDINGNCLIDLTEIAIPIGFTIDMNYFNE